MIRAHKIIKMNSEELPPYPKTSKEVKKKYCDGNFKTQLSKALKINGGEADNIEKIQSNRHLSAYPKEKIISFTNSAASNVQKCVDQMLLQDPRGKEIQALTNVMQDIFDTSGIEHPQELPLALKLLSNNDLPIEYIQSENVNFYSLNKFLYSAVNGTGDYVDMNDHTKKVLYDTYNMMMEQVESDAPACLEDLKLKIGTGFKESSHQSVVNLAETFQDPSLNPLNLPFEYLMNGTLP